MVKPCFVRNLFLGLLSAALPALPMTAAGQASSPAVVPQTAAPPDNPVPATPTPDATGITPQGIMGVTPREAPATSPQTAEPVLPEPTPAVVEVPAVSPDTLRAGRRMSRVIGAPVSGAGDQAIGKVEDIVLPQGGGAPVAILSVGGFLGMGARLVAVPADRLLRQAGSGDWMMPLATRESLAALPVFTFE